jgi:hypothetical protein
MLKPRNQSYTVHSYNMVTTVPVALQEWFAAHIKTLRSLPQAGTPASRRNRPGTFVYSDETSCSAGKVVVDIYKRGEGYDSYVYSSYTGLDTIEHTPSQSLSITRLDNRYMKGTNVPSFSDSCPIFGFSGRPMTASWYVVTTHTY